MKNQKENQPKNTTIVFEWINTASVDDGHGELQY
jgi:hypothetical protein